MGIRCTVVGDTVYASKHPEWGAGVVVDRVSARYGLSTVYMVRWASHPGGDTPTRETTSTLRSTAHGSKKPWTHCGKFVKW